MAPPEGDEMHPEFTQQLAARHIIELHEEAAKRRLIRELRPGPGRASRRARWVLERLRLRRPRPATA